MYKIVKLGSVIVASIILTACGGGLFTPDKPLTETEMLLGQDGRTLWEAKLQYVKIVNRDMPGLANDHPEILSSDELRTVLGSLYVTEKSLFKQTEVPLFSRGELQILSTTIASGLSQAQANEDINFVSIGSHAGGLAKESKTTTGRVFMSGGRMNIIFGLIHEPFRDKDLTTGQPIDRRINPLLPGKRTFDSQPAVRVALDSGQSYYLDPETGKERTDWIVIDIATVLATAKERKSGETAGSLTPELREDIARSKQEARNLRYDVSNIKEILFELRDEIDRLNQQIEVLQDKP